VNVTGDDTEIRTSPTFSSKCDRTRYPVRYSMWVRLDVSLLSLSRGFTMQHRFKAYSSSPDD
jgi:hypothetical protein